MVLDAQALEDTTRRGIAQRHIHVARNRCRCYGQRVERPTPRAWRLSLTTDPGTAPHLLDRCRYPLQCLARALISGRHILVIVGLLVSLFMGYLYGRNPIFIEFLNHKLYDTLLRHNHSAKTSGIPVVIDLDEKTLSQFGQWPWPRYRVALLLARARKLGALAVGLDIVFPEPDRTSPRVLQQELRRDLHVNMGFTGLPEALMDHDRVLADVLTTGPFVLGYFLSDRLIAGEGRDTSLCELGRVPMAIVRQPGTPEDRTFLFDAKDVICNIPTLSSAADMAGFYNTRPDSDGVLRRTPLVYSYKNVMYPSLGLATYLEAIRSLTGKLPQAVLRLTPDGVDSLRLGDTVIPLDAEGLLRLNYRGPQRTFRYISAGDILTDKLPANALEGKIAIIGTSAAGLKDLRATPMDPVFPGVEAHCTVIDNILLSDFLSRPYWAPYAEFSFIIGSGLLTTFLLVWTSAVWSLLPVAVYGGGVWFGGNWLMAEQGLVVSPLMPLLTLALNFTILTLLKFWREEGHKKFLQATFSSYLSPELINEMFQSKKMPELGGEARTITAYFTDIQGFSTFSEKLTATQLVELLNEYLSAMTDILINDRGTLDKYEGDAIVAFFGAPMDVPDHALRACRVAVRMQAKLSELRDKWKNERLEEGEETRNRRGSPENEWHQGDRWPKIVHDMRMRIGINSGEIVVGNMGSSMRMNYTMMGDAVNLAARLEAGAKQFGIFTCASSYTLDQLIASNDRERPERVRDYVEARFVDRITVVGKSEPVDIYEILSLKGGLTPTQVRLFETFEKGMESYRAMEWDFAIGYFLQSLEFEENPSGISPSRVYLERCRSYKTSPPVAQGEAWDGVYRLTEK